MQQFATVLRRAAHVDQLAAACFHEALAISQALGSKTRIGAGTRLLAGSGFPFDTPDRLDYEWMVAHTRRQLPEAAFAAA